MHAHALLARSAASQACGQISPRIDLEERVVGLMEKAEILRRQFLASQRTGCDASSKELWGALTRITAGAPCPRCRSILTAVPPETMLLLACPKCGFVGKRCVNR